MEISLPEFERPPVVEVALSLQFEPLERLSSVHLGLVWNKWRGEGFSRTEDHGDLEPVFEEFAPPSPRVGIKIRTFADAPPLPRVWFLNEAGTEMIQVQKDRLIVNWRRGAGDQPYPRYTHILKRFKTALAHFTDFLRTEALGEVTPTQCEVTYVNHIVAERELANNGDLAQIVTTWRQSYSDAYLGQPEDVTFVARYRMANEAGDPIGRLHVALQPGLRRADSAPIYAMNITARGGPVPLTLDGAFELFDKEHEWIVRGFTSITTAQLHDLWGRKTDG